MTTTDLVVRPEQRGLFALILMFDGEARQTFRRLRDMGATDLRLDHMLVREPDGAYSDHKDPGAWNATVRAYGYVCAVRREEGWPIHG